MSKILTFLKKYWLLIMIVLAALLWIINSFLGQSKNNESTQTTPTPNSATANYKSITPGISTEADLQKNLGTALKVQTKSGITSYDYTSNNNYRNTQFQSENGKIVFIKEIISFTDKRNASEVVNTYGQSKNILYGSNPNSAFHLYVYPQNGIAYVGTSDGTLTEIWYFQPLNIQDFITKWASEYSISPPTENLGY